MKKYLILLLIIFISCGSPESLEEEIVPLEEEILSLEEEDNNKPDSSSEDQQEASSETNLFIGEIIQDNTFIDFHRYIDVGGLRIFALSDVSGELINLQWLLSVSTRLWSKLSIQMLKSNNVSLSVILFLLKNKRCLKKQIEMNLMIMPFILLPLILMIGK